MQKSKIPLKNPLRLLRNSNELATRVLQEEPNHLGCGVGSLRKGMGTGGAATRPSVAGAMNDPLFHYRLAAGISMQYAAVREPTRDLAFFDPPAERRALARLRNDCIGVAGVDRGILVAMEYDRRDNSWLQSRERRASVSRRWTAIAFHCRERRG